MDGLALQSGVVVMTAISDWLSDFWATQPQGTYEAWLSGNGWYRPGNWTQYWQGQYGNRPANWTQYWQDQYENVPNRYMGDVYRQMQQQLDRGVAVGDLNLPEWMDWLNTLDPRREWNMLPRYQRGLRPSTFAPRMSRIGW